MSILNNISDIFQTKHFRLYTLHEHTIKIISHTHDKGLVGSTLTVEMKLNEWVTVVHI